MKNSKNNAIKKAVGMDGEYDIPQPMTKPKAIDSSKNDKGNALRIIKGGPTERLLKSIRQTESERTGGKPLPWRDK